MARTQVPKAKRRTSRNARSTTRGVADDFELIRSDDHFEVVGPSGARIGLRLDTKSREREPGCRDRVEFELRCRAAGKRCWQGVAYLYAHDSYEDELRHVLEDSTLWEAPLTACVADLGTAAAPLRLLEALAERCEDGDAEKVIGLFLSRWDSVYRGK